MRIRLSTNYKINKVLTKIEIIVAVLNKANKVSLIAINYSRNKSDKINK